MKRCIQCGAQLNDTDKFCQTCGAGQPIIRDNSYIFCHNCGMKIMRGSRFCPGCGSPIYPGTGQQQAYQQAPPPPQQQAYRQAPPPQQQTYQQVPPPQPAKQQYSKVRSSVPQILRELSTRVLISGILWISIASLQLLCALIILVVLAVTGDYGFAMMATDSYGFAICIYGSLGTWNLVVGIGEIRNGTQINHYDTKKVMASEIASDTFNVGTFLFVLYNLYVVYNGVTSGNVFGIIMGLIILAAVLMDSLGVLLYYRMNRDNFMAAGV